MYRCAMYIYLPCSKYIMTQAIPQGDKANPIQIDDNDSDTESVDLLEQAKEYENLYEIPEEVLRQLSNEAWDMQYINWRMTLESQMTSRSNSGM